jgi:transcription initiation factor TFIID subunit TAF12
MITTPLEASAAAATRQPRQQQLQQAQQEQQWQQQRVMKVRRKAEVSCCRPLLYSWQHWSKTWERSMPHMAVQTAAATTTASAVAQPLWQQGKAAWRLRLLPRLLPLLLWRLRQR